ncbi:MAG: amino acid adenylation domain-containing protein, partial [bacterium]|nr:amino acid adenylation domain-containing protein [bacterium]
LNNPDLTAEKFLTNIYRTGDRARWLPDGTVEFFGRRDHQIKIRGFRVELGEIENQLLKNKEIKAAVVTHRESGDLCAYVVPEQQGTVQDFDPSALKEFLSLELPPYMIPTHIVTMEQFPVTPGGKIDRQALPSPEVSAAEQYTAPEDDHQTLLADIWSGVLGVEKERIGIDTNFFETGGDSIKVIQISARLRKHGLKLENGDVFQYPTIRQLSGFITPLDHAANQETVKGDVPLTPIQHWFFAENTVEPHHFNQAVMLFSPDRFDPETVKAVFQKIQQHHDALRMTFRREGDKITQFNGENTPLSLDIHDLRHMDGEEARVMLHEAANRIQAGINLETGPPLKLGLFQLSDGDRLLVVVHHLVMDGISWRILFEDIDRLYRDYRDGKQPELPPKSDSFKQWAEELVKYAQTPGFLKEKEYWKPMESVTTTRVVPIEAGTAAAGSMKDVENLAVTLEPGQTQLLLSGVNHAFGTDINDILLTGLGLALHSLYGVRQFPVVMEGHGREDILKGVDITRTVGWFTSQYPVLLDFSHARDRGRQVKEVKETLRRVPHKGIGYGILKYLTGEEHKEGMGFSLKPQVAFNYLGQFDADLETTGFGMAAEPVGLTRSEKGTQEHELEVVVMITGGRLVLSVSFGKNRFKPSAIEELLEAYKNELGGLIDFCTAREERERTPSDFTSKGLTVTDLEIIQKAVTGPVEDIYRLTPMQEGMLFHTVYDEDGEGGTSAYFEQISYHLHGELDAGAVEKSLNELLKRHDILRTAFVHRGLDRPVQVVSAEREADFYWKDIHENIPPEGTEVFIEKFKAEDRRRSFDLVKDVLMRVSVFRTGKEDYEFTWSHHHILMDGWCNGILIGEFFHIYNSILGGSEYRLPEGTAYRTYIRWLEVQDPDVSKRYWADYLSGYETAAGVPRLKELPTARADYKNKKVTVSLDTDETGRLVRLTAALRVTVNTLVQALWGVVFGRYNGCRDVVFGAVVSGRPAHIEDVERMVGLFINTVPVRIRYGEDTDFASLVKEIQQVAVESETHHYYPLAEIQSHSVLKQRLMDHIMVFENFPVAQQIEEKAREMESAAGGKPVLRVSRIEAFEQTNYDFNLIVLPGPRLSMRFEFNGHMFDGSLVAGMGAHLVTALRSILDSEDLNRLRTVDISILAEEEKKRLLEDFNATETPYPEDKTVHGLFEEQVERTPGDIAVIGAEGRFTFGELNERANGVAHGLREQGVQRGVIVAVKTDRSVETTAVILGILKAGGAYLPLDEQMPQGRIDYMLADSGAKIVLNSSDAAASGAGNPETGVEPGDMVHVLYTSGSTGRPKGVVLTHGNVVNFIHDLHERFYEKYRTGARLKLAVIAPYVFAGSVKQVFTSLVFGHTLHIVPEECRFDGELLAQFFDDSGIHITDVVPAHIKLLTEAFRRREKKFCGVRHFNISADVLSKELVAEFLGILEEPKPDLANLYGPTECCVDAVGYDINALEVEGLRTVPIGEPLGNTSVYVLDSDMQLVPVGVTGEIYIAGHGVARGYLNNPNLTAESFLIKSFCPAFLKKRAAGASMLLDPIARPGSFPIQQTASQAIIGSTRRVPAGGPPEGSKFYRTGDLGRWLSDGKLEFLGRRDRQVKIRGYRIETGEIESLMRKHESVERVVIRPLEMVGGETVLCAYFVPVGSIDLTPSLWREYLGKQLPSYMIPSHFMAMETIPLTASGKPDIKALPTPEAVPAGGAYRAPANESEEKIVQTWAEVLGMEAGTIGVEDDFFALGGNSINVFKVVNRLNRDFEIELPLSSLFLYPTVRQLAENVMEESLLGKLECVVRLNRSTAGKNIFILHPMHGMAYLYRGLAEALEGRFNVYGIQGRGLAKPGPLPETMADMVSDYIEQIRAVQPEGPYIIGGHCFGDIAAYNLVKQLENMGQVVERQVMFDEPSFIPAFVERHHKRRERMGAVSGPLKKVARRMAGKNEEEEQLTPFQQARQEFESKGDAGVTGPMVPASLENDPEQRKARVHIHIKRLDEGYWKIDPFQRQLGIIRAPLLILKAAKRNHRNFAMKELKRMTYGEVTLRETPGTHETLFLPEYIPTLAGILKETL